MSMQFQNPRDPNNTGVRAKFEEWMRELELLGDEESLATVVEFSDHCGPNCPHAETVLTVRGGENERVFTIRKPLVFVRRPDIQALLQS